MTHITMIIYQMHLLIAPKAPCLKMGSAFIFYLNFFLFSRSELLIEAEARSAESLEARSAESLADVAPKARAAQADANLDQFIYIYIIYLDVCTVLNSDNWLRNKTTSCLSLFSTSLRFSA